MARRTVSKRRADSASPPSSARQLLHADGWENVFTGLGTARDKRRGASVVAYDLDWKTCESLYRGDDMAARIVERPVREMLRKWVDVLVEGSTEEGKGVTAVLDELGAKKKLREALYWKRAYGGSAIVLGADDGAVDLTRPLNERKLTALRWLTVLDRTEIRPVRFYSNPKGPRYGEPEVYQLNPVAAGVASLGAGVRIHESRVIAFRGIQVSRRHAAAQEGWGDSVFVRVLEVLADYGMVWGGASAILQDFSQAVFRIRGLTELLSRGAEGETIVKKRIEWAEMARSLLRAVVLDAGSGEEGDAGETFERKPTPIAGYEGLLSKFDQRLAASADMPVTLLMGQAPAGLNATGEADVLWWTEHIEGLQEEDLREPLNRIIRLILLSREGPTSGVEPENWSVAFRPLRQLSPLQEADRRLKIAQADTTYTNAGVLMPEEVAVSRFGGDRFGEELAIDEELRRKMEETPKAKDEEPEEAAPSDRASPARPTTA
jgi:hypothetical protein